MVYDRKVRYLDYYEGGQRIRGCGYVKLELKEDNLRIELRVRGIENVEGRSSKILLCGGGKEWEAGTLAFDRGMGVFQGEWGAVAADQLPEEIRLPLDTEREISCSWKNSRPGRLPQQPVSPRENRQEERNPEPESDSRMSRQSIRQEESEQHPEEIRRDAALTLHSEEREGTRDKCGAFSEEEEFHTGRRRLLTAPVREGKEQEGQQPVRLLEDKWLQLYSIYPHVRPFQDEREYLSIGPADFLLFPTAAYRRANNSFLLHGFYNYQHLILTRIESRGEIRYYIGVPGNFFEREKQVALMFGFESFECAEEPAQPGDFGYYMMRTEL